MKMLKRPQQYGELVNLSMEPSDQQVNMQRSYVLAMVKDSDERTASSQLQEHVDFVDIIDEVQCLAGDGGIKKNILGTRETSRDNLSCRGSKPMFGFDRAGVPTTASTQSDICVVVPGDMGHDDDGNRNVDVTAYPRSSTEQKSVHCKRVVRKVRTCVHATMKR